MGSFFVLKAAVTAPTDFKHSHFDFAAVSRLYVGLFISFEMYFNSHDFRLMQFALLLGS
jgi:hypothetical protein